MELDHKGEDGYCYFLEESDCILLWDQVKICGINEDNRTLDDL